MTVALEYWVEVSVENGRLEIYERMGHKELEELCEALSRLGLQVSDVRSTPCG